MKQRSETIKANNQITARDIAKKFCVWAVLITAVLMIPFVANAPWTSSDFIFSAIVLSTCAFAYEVATRSMNNLKERAVIAAAVLFFILLVMGWAASGP